MHVLSVLKTPLTTHMTQISLKSPQLPVILPQTLLLLIP